MVRKYNLNYFSPSKFLWLALWLSMSILVNSLYLHKYIYINIHALGAILVQGGLLTRSGLFIVLITPTINGYLGNLQSLKKSVHLSITHCFWICLLTFSVGIIILPIQEIGINLCVSSNI